MFENEHHIFSLSLGAGRLVSAEQGIREEGKEKRNLYTKESFCCVSMWSSLFHFNRLKMG
jgi:hypothetical protein